MPSRRARTRGTARSPARILREKVHRTTEKERQRRWKRDAKGRAARGVDHKTDALEKEASRASKFSEARKRARDDDGSGRMVYCKYEDCKGRGKKVMFYGPTEKRCKKCFRPMAFVEEEISPEDLAAAAGSTVEELGEGC